MSIEKFYPSAEELSSVCSKVRCPERNCPALFQCTSNLNMHLIKHHKISQNGLTSKNSSSQYFCPVNSCSYYKNSFKFFKKLKYLKQHYLKVHASKDFSCKTCHKKFSTLSFLSLHQKNCGKIFNCVCGCSYTSSEAILTHIKRKGNNHKLEKSSKTEEVVINDISRKKDSIVRRERLLYPKLAKDMSFPVHYIAAMALSELSTPKNISKCVDKEIQTEFIDSDLGKDAFNKVDKKIKYSQETQTTGGKNRKVKISKHTQTNHEYLKRKNKSLSKTNCKKGRKTTETQTKEQQCLQNIIRSDKSLKSDIIGDEEKARKWLWDIVTSSTTKTADLEMMHYSDVTSKDQGTCVQLRRDPVCRQDFDLNKLCNIETQTDLDAFLTDCNEDTNFTLCSTTETQTTDDFACLLYSNMCTQTCEEVDQLFNFNFVHNETQTAWPDLEETIS